MANAKTKSAIDPRGAEKINTSVIDVALDKLFGRGAYDPEHSKEQTKVRSKKFRTKHRAHGSKPSAAIA
jgi:hypothetical protein